MLNNKVGDNMKEVYKFLEREKKIYFQIIESCTNSKDKDLVKRATTMIEDIELLQSHIEDEEKVNKVIKKGKKKDEV